MADPVGSSYATAKAAIYDKLITVPALQGVVKIRYESPTKGEHEMADTGEHWAAWFDDTHSVDRFRNGETKNKVVCGLPLVIDEDYEILMIVQALNFDADDDGSQRNADMRVDRILYPIFKAIATDPSLGLENLDGFQHFQITHWNFERLTGPLNNGEGHGSGIRIFFQVESRLDFYQ